MRQKRRFYVQAYIGVLLPCFSSVALACKCGIDPTPAITFQKADAVFEGKVTSIVQVPGGFKNVSLEVNRYWKGHVRHTAIVSTDFDPNVCGYPFYTGGTYLVYAYAYPTSGRNLISELHVSLCSRTTNIKNAEEDLAALGAGWPIPNPLPRLLAITGATFVLGAAFMLRRQRKFK